MKKELKIILIGTGEDDQAPYIAVNKIIEDLSESHINFMFCQDGKDRFEPKNGYDEQVLLDKSFKSINIKILNGTVNKDLRNAEQIISKDDRVEFKYKKLLQNNNQYSKVRSILNQVVEFSNVNKNILIWIVDIGYVEFFKANFLRILEEEKQNSDIFDKLSISILPFKILPRNSNKATKVRVEASKKKLELQQNSDEKVSQHYDNTKIEYIKIIQDSKTKKVRLESESNLINLLSLITIIVPFIDQKRNLVKGLDGLILQEIDGNGVVQINPLKLDKEIREKLGIVQKYFKFDDKSASEQMKAIQQVKDVTSLKTRKPNMVLVIFPKYQSSTIFNLVKNWIKIKPVPKNVKFVIIGMTESDPAGLGLVNNILRQVYLNDSSSVEIFHDETFVCEELKFSVQELQMFHADRDQFIKRLNLEEGLGNSLSGRIIFSLDENLLKNIEQDYYRTNKGEHDKEEENYEKKLGFYKAIAKLYLENVVLIPELTLLKQFVENHSVNYELLKVGWDIKLDEKELYTYGIENVKRKVLTILENSKANNNIIVILTGYPYVRAMSGYFRCELQPIQKQYQDKYNISIFPLKIRSLYTEKSSLEKSKKIEVELLQITSSNVKALYRNFTPKEIILEENNKTKDFESKELTPIIEELLLSCFRITNFNIEKLNIIKKKGGKVIEEEDNVAMVEINPNNLTAEEKLMLEIFNDNAVNIIPQVPVNIDEVSEAVAPSTAPIISTNKQEKNKVMRN